MVFLAKDHKGGRTYLYLRENHRVNGKSVRKWQIKLGVEEDIRASGEVAFDRKVRTKSIEFGLVAALLRVSEKLNLVEVINRVAGKRAQGLGVGEHVLIAAINRCVKPVSKRQLHEWLESTILQKVYPSAGLNLNSSSYWEHFRYLTGDIIERAEWEITRAVVEQFGVRYEDLMFDPTNFFTYINPRQDNQTLPNHGHPKDGKAVLNLVNVSLFCALDAGVPLLHLVYPGNVQDANHFKSAALPRLKQRLAEMGVPGTRVTLTFDKGNLSEDAFTFIDSEGLDYIASDRPSSHKDLKALPPEAFDMFVLPNGKEVGVTDRWVEKYGKVRRFVVVYNPAEAAWKRENFEKKVQKVVRQVKNFFQDRLNHKQWADPGKVRAKCARVLKKKFAPLVAVEVSGEAGSLTLTVAPVAEAIAVVTQTYGKSFLMTSREDLPAADVAWAYRQQYLVERAFTWLKGAGYLAVRPMFHRVDSSVRGHVFTCFVGLLLLSLLVRELTQLGVSTSIQHAVKHLKEIKVTRYITQALNNPVENLDDMSDKARKIYDALNLGQYL
jgi:transposase